MLLAHHLPVQPLARRHWYGSGKIDAGFAVAEHSCRGSNLRLVAIARTVIGQNGGGEGNKQIDVLAHSMAWDIRHPYRRGIQPSADAAVVALVLDNIVAQVKQDTCSQRTDCLDSLPRLAADSDRDVHDGSFG